MAQAQTKASDHFLWRAESPALPGGLQLAWLRKVCKARPRALNASKDNNGMR
jgi:hypothetical protein